MTQKGEARQRQTNTTGSVNCVSVTEMNVTTTKINDLVPGQLELVACQNDFEKTPAITPSVQTKLLSDLTHSVIISHAET